jgi:2,4-dienoyl-CoA reductase-like NADH-dependent reductase (Old Yellow Enzyme family)
MSADRQAPDDSPMTATSPLFEPFQLRKVLLRNRIAMAPMTRDMCPGGVPGSEHAAYYRRRAEGGTGLIITEGTAVNRTGMRNENIPRLFGEDAIEGWRGVADAVHSAGAALVPQLWHIGIQKPDAVLNPDAVYKQVDRVGPSGLTGTGEQLYPPMTQASIDETIADFGAATAAAKHAGCDGIEIHGAHGYLPDQFMWSVTNRRGDRYGGDMKDRTRFAAELVRECRRQGGPDFPILYRFSQWKVTDYQAQIASTPQELEAVLRPLVDAGVDLFHCSTRRFVDPAFADSPGNLASWTKKVTGTPTMAVGSVTLDVDFKSEGTGISASGLSMRSLDAVIEGLERGDFDLIAVGRALISNPDWANLIRSGDQEQLQAFAKSHLAQL